MSDYQVKLLGVPGVFNNGELIHFPYRKAEGIFYYLCIEKSVNRDELVSIFWGSNDEASGRKNLRQALFQIRRCLGNDIILLQGKNALALNPELVPCTEWDSPDEEFALYQERFLDFFYLKDCPEFEAWVENKQRLQLSRCLGYIKNQLKEPSIYSEVSRLHRLIDTWAYWQPWDEEMVLTGMKCYIQAESYDLGIHLYHEYAKCLRKELDEDPSPAVESLFKTLFRRKEIALMKKNEGKNQFFGRLRELQYIDEQILEFLNSNPSASVIIRGEMGVGKTALMHQILEMHRSSDVLDLVAHCYVAESDFPLKSWSDIFKQLETLQKEGNIHLPEDSLKLIHLLLTGMTPENPNIIRGSDGELISYTALENGVLNLFRELSEQWKIILYFDSLQWMDTVSQRLLQRIMIELGNRQIFMIATCRVDEEQDIRSLLVALRERDIITILPLLCFTEEETEDIVKEALQEYPDTEINAGELFQRTGGNALALMDTLNLIQQEGELAGSTLPRIDMMIQLWLEGLTKQQRKVLDALSIYVEHAELEELELLVNMERMELIEVLEQLLTTHFVTEEIRDDYVIYKFRYRFYKDYVYQHLSLGKRRLWHRTVAGYYENQKNEGRWPKRIPYTIQHYECSGETERANQLRDLHNEP